MHLSSRSDPLRLKARPVLLFGAALMMTLAACPERRAEGLEGEPGRTADGIEVKTFAEDLPGLTLGRVGAAQRIVNTRAMNAALGNGAILHLRAGSRIEIASTLVIPSGAGIIGEAGKVKPIIFMPASHFSNNSTSTGRYATTAVGIDFSGVTSGIGRAVTGVRLENFVLQSEVAVGRSIRGIVGRNVTNCMIRDVEVTGIPTGVGITLASARRCTIEKIYIHDFTDNYGWANPPQMTGIEIDNDRVNGIASSGVVIDDFRIENLRVTGRMLAKWDYQSDGINIAHHDSRVRIANGGISHVGEGIDTFGSDGTIENVSIEDSRLFGLKFVHGASRNRVRNIIVTNAGLAGVTFAGSNTAGQDTTGNVIAGLKIRGIDPARLFSSHSTAGVLIIDNGGSAGKPRGNRVVGASIDLGANGKYGWLDTSSGSGNEGLDVEVKGGALSTPVLVRNGRSIVRLRSGRRRTARPVLFNVTSRHGR